MMTDQTVQSLLSPEAAAFFRVREEGTVTSTNSLLKEAAARGEPEGLVMTACRQTAGRGRMGHSFYSPEDTGLYLSLLVRPDMPAADAVLLTCLAAAAAAEACERTAGLPAGAVGIKWVNDLYRDGRKICGILTESQLGSDGRVTGAVVGLGFNLAPPAGGFPEEIRQTAGSLFEGAAPADARARLAAALLERFLAYYREFPRRTFLDGYRERSFVVGRRVWILSGETVTGSGTAVGLDDRCRLLVKDEEGTITALDSGDIRVRPR